MIADIIKLLQSNPFYGAGKFTEIAKGQNERVSNFRDFKIQIKRQWQLLKKLT